MTKVSIIVPIYNKEQYLKKCIESIKKQSYQNVEIILIDDGSTDSSRIIMDDIKETDSRIKTIYKMNEGVSVARNLGISVSTGEYLVFVDPDDWVSPNLIKKLLECTLKTSSDIVSCCAFVNLNESQKKNRFFFENGKIEKKRAIAQLLSNKHYNDADSWIDVGVPWGKIYKKEFIIKNDLYFNPKLRRNQDNIFNLYCFHFANKIYYLDEPLYHYRYENYNNIFSGLVKDAEELYSEIATETYVFINKYYQNDVLLVELTRSKLLMLLIMMMNTKTFNSNNKVNFRFRIDTLNKKCAVLPFKIVFKEKYINYVKTYHKTIFFLLKHNNYLLCSILFLFRNRLKRIESIIKKIFCKVKLLQTF